MSSKPRVSFEFFPPKPGEPSEQFWKVIKRLEEMKPLFVSVTYGAGGTTRHRTLGTINAINERTSLTAAAHLTCVGATRAEVDEVVRGYWQAGIRHIVALRGDPPGGVGGRFVPAKSSHPDLYSFAANDGNRWQIVLVNRNPEQQIATTLKLTQKATGARSFTLSESLGLRLLEQKVPGNGDAFEVTVPAFSAMVIEIR